MEMLLNSYMYINGDNIKSFVIYFLFYVFLFINLIKKILYL